MDRSYPGHSGTRLLAHRLAVCIATLFLLAPLVAALAPPAQAQDADDADEVVIFVLDLSGSMNEPFNDNQTKLDAAKAAFIEAFANVSPDARVGLRTYGDQIEPTTPAEREPSCTSDTRVASPVAPLRREDLITQVQDFTALGDTPIGLAIREASTDIPAGSTGTIVLFSDGRDECFDADLDGDPASGPSFGEDPCETAKSITAGDSPVDRVVTVGFRADMAAETELRCIAESTGGTYTAIETPEDARDVLPRLLVQLSAPREAQQFIGREIQGATTTDAAPDLVRLDEVGADTVLYTDSIDMNSERIYRVAEFGPDGGTFTATVFGLPPEPGIALDMQIFVPELNRRFFAGEHGDFNAGLPGRPTASIRCTDCQITDGPHEAFIIVSLEAQGSPIEGAYELEILTEGPGFGGSTTSCSAPQECFYPQEIIDLTEQLEATRSSIRNDIGELAPNDLVAERDQLRIDVPEQQDAVDAANARAAQLEERIPLAPSASSSFRLTLLMILAGVGLALAPVQKLRREQDDSEAAEDAAEPPTKKRGRKKKKSDDADPDGNPVASPLVGQMPGETGRPSLDNVGPAPAISPNIKTDGNNWDAELEAAKAALAQQRPERTTPVAAPAPAAMPEPTNLPAEPFAIDPPTATPAVALPPAPIPQASPRPTVNSGFSEEQHAAAKAAAEKIIAQRVAEQTAATSQPAGVPLPDNAMAEQAAAEQAARQTAEQAAAEDAAARATTQAATATPAASPVVAQPSAPAPVITDEERRQEARQRMLAEQNTVASSSPATESTAGTAAGLEPAAESSQPVAPVQPTTTIGAGWYEDPAVVGQFRWWDGSAWTVHTAATNQEQAPS